jgi:hypothetical protein
VDYDCVRAVLNPHGVDANCLWQQRYPVLWTRATAAAAQIGSSFFDTFVSVAEARDRIITNIDNGIAILQHRDHGSVTGWGDPDFDYTDVDTLRCRYLKQYGKSTFSILHKLSYRKLS